MSDRVGLCSKRHTSPVSATARLDESHSSEGSEVGWQREAERDAVEIVEVEAGKTKKKKRKNTNKEYRSVKVFVGSFNVNEKPLPADLSDWLRTPKRSHRRTRAGRGGSGGEGSDHNGEGSGDSGEDDYAENRAPDVLAFGFQELHPLPWAFVHCLSSEAYEGCASATECRQLVEAALRKWWGDGRASSSGRSPSPTFTLAASHARVGLLVLVYTNDASTATAAVRDVRYADVGTGIGGLLGNKGAVAVMITLRWEEQWRHCEDTSLNLCFINAHFAPHEHNLERRNRDFWNVCRRMTFGPVESDSGSEDAEEIVADNNQRSPEITVVGAAEEDGSRNDGQSVYELFATEASINSSSKARSPSRRRAWKESGRGVAGTHCGRDRWDYAKLSDDGVTSEALECPEAESSETLDEGYSQPDVSPLIATSQTRPGSGFSATGAASRSCSGRPSRRRKRKAAIFDCDAIFFFGDLNYRVLCLHPDLPSTADPWGAAKISFSEMMTRVLAVQDHQDPACGDAGNFASLAPFDQLENARAFSAAVELKRLPHLREAERAEKFHSATIPLGFQEGEFWRMKPTYKYQIGTDKYLISAPKRLPSWCDRILWYEGSDSESDCLRAQVQASNTTSSTAALSEERQAIDVPKDFAYSPAITLLGYTSHTCIRVSDHKPVSASFKISLEAPVNFGRRRRRRRRRRPPPPGWSLDPHRRVKAMLGAVSDAAIGMAVAPALVVLAAFGRAPGFGRARALRRKVFVALAVVCFVTTGVVLLNFTR